MTETPRIYVACLASYNAGTPHGAWIDVETPDAIVWEQIEEMLKASPQPDAEEYAIHDSENWGEFNVNEHDSIKELCELADLIEEYGTFIASVVNHYGDINDAKTAMTDNYSGHWESIEEYAEDYLDGCEEIPEHIAPYIDMERYARDLCIDMAEVDDPSGGVHLFHP